MMFNLQTPITMKLLLLVFPLIWFEVTFGVRSEPNVIKVEVGSDVILPCSLSSKEDIVSKRFEWKKDDQKTVFIYDSGIDSSSGSGQFSHFKDELKSGNASIIIRNTTVADSGNYTCDFPQLQPRQIFHIKLHVGAAPKPSVTSLKQTENWSLLQCEVRDAFPKPKLRWQDSDGKKLPAEEPKESERGDRYDVILQINVTKTDNYRCDATQEEINHQIYSEIYAFISGAAPKPYVVIVDQTADSALLQCEVRGAFPKPKLHWQDSDGKKLPAEEPKESERGGRYDVILQTTVTKTNIYRCVATQEEINHQIWSDIYVYIHGKTILVLFVISVLAVIVLTAVLCYKKCKEGPSSWLSVLPSCSGPSSQPSEAIPKDSSHSGEKVSFSPRE